MQIEVIRFFEAAHKLPDSPDLLTKQCARLHGHTYCAKVTARGDVQDSGMVVDFTGIKQIIDKFDHQFLNDFFAAIPATAENIALRIKHDIESIYPHLTVSVQLAEGYKGESTSWVTTK